jgi:hypothetical protein
MRRYKLLPWLVVLGVVVCQRSGEGAAAVRVALVVDRSENPLAGRLRAELRSVGFDTVTAVRDADVPPALEVTSISQRTGAVAAISVVSAAEAASAQGGGPGRGPVVWVMDRARNRAVKRQLAAQRGDSSNRVIALRAVELLRASLMELRANQALANEARAVPVPETRATSGLQLAAASRATTARFALELEGTATLAPGGLGLMGQLLVGAGWYAMEHLRLELFSLVPLSPGRASSDEGEVELHAWIIGAGPRLLFTGREATLQPSVGGGMGAAFVFLRGRALAPYADKSDWSAAACPYLRAGLLVRLTDLLRASVDLLAGVALPSSVVTVSGRDIASWGRPFISAALGFEVLVP